MPGLRRKNFGGGTSAKSSASIHSSPENATERVPSASLSGLLTMSKWSTTGSPCSSAGQLVMTSFSGFRTAMRRWDVRFSSRRTYDSSASIDCRLFVFVVPMSRQKSRIAGAG